MNNINLTPILSPLFLLGLFLLLLNDFVLKAHFGNFLTGKLSDFAGLFVLPLFLVTFLPKNRLLIYIATGLFFIYWKSPLSEGLIEFVNSLEVFRIGRTVDYSDLAALLVLPASHSYFRRQTEGKTHYSVNFLNQVFQLVIITISVFAFAATTLTKDRRLYLEDAFLVNENHRQIESSLKTNQAIRMIRVRRDDEFFDTNKYPNIKIDRRTYFFDFLIDEKTCDSNATAVSFVITETERYAELRGIRFEFECRQYEGASNLNALDKSYIEHTRAIFHREVMQHLTQFQPK